MLLSRLPLIDRAVSPVRLAWRGGHRLITSTGPCRVRALPGDWVTKESQLPENPSRGGDEGFLVGGGCRLAQRQRNVGLSLQSEDSGIDTREYFPTAAPIFVM